MNSLHTALLAGALLCPLTAAGAGADGKPADEVAQFEALYFDQTIEAATRAPKPLSQIAENVTVVTAEEIEAMNAHTLAEALNRVTGVFVQRLTVRFGGTALAHIQGSGETDFAQPGHASEDRHVLVLLDGMPWNNAGWGPSLETIPVGIVDRIEILKGPASSTWGSSLGGVINVLTKKAGSALRPTGTLSASYGERDAFDGRAEAAGAAGPVGYYVQGQAQHAGWDNGDFESRSAFGKVDARFSDAVTLSLTSGYTRPEFDNGHLPSGFAFAQEELRAVFGRAALDARVGPTLSVHAVAYRHDEKREIRTQEDGLYDYSQWYDPVPPIQAGDLFENSDFEDKAWGAQGHLVWAPGSHTLVLGSDYHHLENSLTTERGLGWAAQPAPGDPWVAPDPFTVEATSDRWGVYLNDTIVWGPATVTPGLRYDDNSKGGSFWSPSLGAAWRLGKENLLRVSAARGFTYPPLNWVSGGGMTSDPNPDLDPERVWSYQAGIESTSVPFLWLKATAFYHDVDDVMESEPSSPGPTGWWTVNAGEAHRRGFEMEVETARLAGLSAKGGFAWVRVTRSGTDLFTGEDKRDQDQYQANLRLSYRQGTWAADLLGHFAWWDLGPGAEEGKRDDWLWDLAASKGFATPWGTTTELFGTVRNLFSGDQNHDTDRGTEPRWIEGGVRLRF